MRTQETFINMTMLLIATPARIEICSVSVERMIQDLLIFKDSDRVLEVATSWRAEAYHATSCALSELHPR